MIYLLSILLFCSLLSALYAWTLVYLLKDRQAEAIYNLTDVRQAEKEYLQKLLVDRANTIQKLHKQNEMLTQQLEQILATLITNGIKK